MVTPFPCFIALSAPSLLEIEMNDFALIFEFIDRNGNGVYGQYLLEDAKTRKNRIGEVRLPPDHSLEDEIEKDYGIEGAGTG